MGHIRSNYIPDHWTRRELVKELRIEHTYLSNHPGEIIRDGFWLKAESSYLSSPAQFARHHMCPELLHILRHDHLTSLPVPPVITPLMPSEPPTLPPVVIQPHSLGGGGGSPPGSVPEPTSMILWAVAIAWFVLRTSSRKSP